MTHVILTRHGHVDGIDPPRFRGRLDLPLTELGRRQAQATALRLQKASKIAALYSSPMQRCMTTARIISGENGIPIEALDDLNDLDYGDWQGKLEADVSAESPRLFAMWKSTPELVRFPNGESLQDLAARTADALRLMISRHPTETVILVGHDSVNRSLLMQVLGQPLSAYWRLVQNPCTLNEFEIVDGRTQVFSVNDHHHVTTA